MINEYKSESVLLAKYVYIYKEFDSCFLLLSVFHAAPIETDKDHISAVLEDCSLITCSLLCHEYEQAAFTDKQRFRAYVGQQASRWQLFVPTAAE